MAAENLSKPSASISHKGEFIAGGAVYDGYVPLLRPSFTTPQKLVLTRKQLGDPPSQSGAVLLGDPPARRPLGHRHGR